MIAGICPEARVIDITHGVPRHDVRAGALILRNALPYMPPGVHLAVVDPEVGAERRAVALRTAEEDRLLVGPDNGLLSLAAERFGGVVEAVDIGRSPWRLEPVSATFHGRDIFAPVAAHLAAGRRSPRPASRCDPDDLVRLELPRPRREDGALVAHALDVDRFGNVALDVTHDDLADAGLRLGRTLELEVGRPRVTAWLRGHVRRRPAGRAARLRGRLPHARGRGQPRQRRRAARPRARRRAANRGGVSASAAARPPPRASTRPTRAPASSRPAGRRTARS